MEGVARFPPAFPTDTIGYHWLPTEGNERKIYVCADGYT